MANVSPPGLTIHIVERKDIDHSQEVGRSKYLTQVWSPAYFFCLHIFTLLVCPKDHLAGSGEGTTHCEKKGQFKYSTVGI